MKKSHILLKLPSSCKGHRITVACRSVTPAMLMKMRGSFRSRINACEKRGGQYVEHLLNN
jgi:hypothetical protein